MQQVALFRNVNQGQRGHPRTVDLLDAFAEAGVEDAAAFQSNGTVVFTAADGGAVVDDVRMSLAARGLFDDVVYVRSLSFIEGLVAAHSEVAQVGRYEVTFFPTERSITGQTSTEASRRLCSVVEHGPGWVLVLNERDRQSNGTPTVESILRAPATSRGLSTLVRLVGRFAR